MPTEEILFFLCLNDRGGAEISMVTLAQGLLQRGRHVTLAVYGKHPELARTLGFTGEIIDLGVSRSSGAYKILKELIRQRSFSTLISALPYTNIVAAFAVITAKPFSKKRPRLLLSEHGVEGLMAYKKSFFFRMLTRFCYCRATTIIAVSQKLAQAWRAALPPRASVLSIYNPVVSDILPPTSPPPHEWLAPGEPPVIIAAGRLKTEKNFALLIKAFAKVTAQKPTRLIILGEGEQRPQLEKAAQLSGVNYKILLPGFQSDSAAWLAHASVFVSTSNREGFGNAIVEAMAQGLPIVATDCPYGPSEILQGGRFGRLVPMDNVDALARAILETMEGEPSKAVLQKRAGDFTVSRCIDAYLAVIDNRP